MLIQAFEEITRRTGNGGNVNIFTYPPFWQNLVLVLIGFIPLGIMLWLMFKTDFFTKLMEMMYEGLGKPKYTSEYGCRCPRCQFELRTKKGRKKWAREHKYKKDELV